MLIVGRIINGLSVGICSAQVPVYISEMVGSLVLNIMSNQLIAYQAPPTKRGRVVGMQQWAITWGILIMF